MTRLATRHVFSAERGFHELPADELQFLRFGLARVPVGEAIQIDTGERESLLVVVDAPEEVRLAAGSLELALPARRSVFDELPASVYAPAGNSLELRGPVLAGIFQAHAPDSGGAPYAILPGEVNTAQRGRGNYARKVRDILPAGRRASRLLAGETINPPGNWSSSPPHKHDLHAPPGETRLEEIYLYRTRPPQGFGLQHSYHAGGPSRTFAVGDLDVATIPAGYHPVVAAPGYELYYLWCLAGDTRELCWNPDPAHAWLEQQA
ncbi:MAG TPA: 5-deoxy-glucuronate isomerase [Solirubrobacteraceae bacterium]|nr:5-deoxy-glucuronate isomerase [Solirubrobacteraceae bacterium]